MRLTIKSLAAAAVLSAVLLPASASAKGNCPAKSGTIVKDSIGRIWHQGTSLYGCTTEYGHNPKSKRMGPWKAGTKVVFDGAAVAWTVPLNRDGVKSDRIYAGDVDNRSRWLLGRVLVPATTGADEHEARIQGLVLSDQTVAWVTTTGEVVMAARAADLGPEAAGTLPGPLKVDRKLLLVGAFPDADPAQLLSSLKLEEGEGEGDECGGTNPYTLRFKPTPTATAIGVDWNSDWTSTNCS